MHEFRLPDTTQRVAIVGRTGSGKTQFATWILSNAAFDQQPYIIYDWKRDGLIGQIPYLEEIGLGEVPRHGGLYVVHPLPHDEEAVEQSFAAIWQQENVGLYVDECYMINKNSKWYKACLTQGRSKHIPIINLTQRPVEVSRFMFSESDFYSAFHLNDSRDQDTVNAFMPVDISKRLPQYHSHWYDVGRDASFEMLPAPAAADILTKFNDRLQPDKPARIFI